MLHYIQAWKVNGEERKANMFTSSPALITKPSLKKGALFLSIWIRTPNFRLAFFSLQFVKSSARVLPAVGLKADSWKHTTEETA